MSKSLIREAEARKVLLEDLRVKKGETIYTLVRDVSRSGMSRNISVFIVRKNHKGAPAIRDITAAVRDLLDYPQARNYGYLPVMRVGGAGMDMGFHIVYSLSMALFCPGKYNHDAAYSLKHEWL